MDYELHHRLLIWLEEAAEMLRESIKSPLYVEQKQDASDLVTEMDREIEAFFREKQKAYYPHHRIIGEEGVDNAVSEKGVVWVIDPIDGTLNFVKQKNNFGMMIGIFEDGKPLAGYIYQVMAHELYYGIVGEGVYLNNQALMPVEVPNLRDSVMVGNVGMFALNYCNSQRLLKSVLGVRAHGSAALEIIEVLKGQASCYLSFRLKPWDFAAGWAMCHAAGIKVTQADGSPVSILKPSSVVFAHEHVHRDVIHILNTTKEIGEIHEYS